MDDWRVAQVWRLFEQKVAHPKNEPCRAEWWILWRRLAGGLTAGQQSTLAEPLVAFLRREPARAERAAELHRHEWAEIWRLLGSLELLSASVKEELGEMLLRTIAMRGSPVHLWALGRIGARVPLYGQLNGVLPAEVAERWARALIRGNLKRGEELFFAVAQLTRVTGDRYRDVSSDAREEILRWMKAAAAPRHLLDLIERGGAWRDAEQDLVFGEALPRGLRIAAG